ncbi:GxxExxY protein [Chryseobacterium sp. MDT2-18]|uniref:GxxExxY protein n=1 Tax=Chryseobacterium sp. MDT2-18 TaxID=1259136 RepID=UPI00278330C4|nr:GxxExxY protein [Chryseobacterium sp. MDT2-18]MDQ0476448.1 GxxExxY protein [Chryseobacterium sp. MDT2-18]
MLLHQEISDKIIKAFYAVYNTLGYGFLEKVYENAMMLELRGMGLNVQRQVPVRVFYKDQLVGEYFADLLVEELIIIELKAAENIVEAHECQLINYLKATELEIGLLLNFGKKPQFKRKIYTN